MKDSVYIFVCFNQGRFNLFIFIYIKLNESGEFSVQRNYEMS